MKKLVAACLFLAGAFPPRDAPAKVPDPAHSHVPPVLITCPSGDVEFTVSLRNFVNLPLHGTSTHVPLCRCPEVVVAPVQQDWGYEQLSGCEVLKLTDLDGRAVFRLRAGGVCRDDSTWVMGDGVWVHRIFTVASFDQDGDLQVNGLDAAVVLSKRGTADPTADFDLDGAVTDADIDAVRAHMGHSPATTLDVGDRPDAPLRVSVLPNPARGPVEFTIGLPQPGVASLRVFDLSGRRLATVFDRALEAGPHRARWSGRDDRGERVPAGLYFYRLTMGTRSKAGLIVLVR